jgi:hypothetical protein
MVRGWKLAAVFVDAGTPEVHEGRSERQQVTDAADNPERQFDVVLVDGTQEVRPRCLEQTVLTWNQVRAVFCS